MPSKFATSPMARMRGSEVWHPASISTPPRGCTSSSAPRASSSRGRTPTVKTTTSVALVGAVAELEPGDLTRRDRGRAGSCSCRSCTRMPRALDQPLEGVAAAQIELGRHQPVGGLHDRARDVEPLQRAGGFEAEQPAADDRAGERSAELRGAALDERAQASRRRRACGRRSSPSRPKPSTASRAAYEPVASTSRSYATLSPRLVVTRRASRSMRATASPRTKRTRSSSSTRAVEFEIVGAWRRRRSR